MPLIELVEVESGVGNRLAASVNGELGESIQAFGFAGARKVAHFKIGDVTADMDFMFFGVDGGQRMDPALTRRESTPKVRHIEGKWRDHADTGDHDTALC